MADPDDVVAPADRRVHRILARIAETTSDEQVREDARDLMLTLPPTSQWSTQRVRFAAAVIARIANRRS